MNSKINFRQAKALMKIGKNYKELINIEEYKDYVLIIVDRWGITTLYYVYDNGIIVVK